MKQLKKIITITFLFFIIIGNSQKKEYLYSEKLENQPDLWIITMDKSGSMTDKVFIPSIGLNTTIILDKLKKDFFNLINFEKDYFIFYNTGIVERNEDAKNLKYIKGSFADNYIHTNHLNGKLNFNVHFDSLKSKGLYRYLEDKMISKNKWKKVYPYQQSFVSLIRPLALDKTIQLMNKKAKFNDRYKLLRYNNIYILSITDNADEDDQWLIDYRTVRDNAPEKLTEINNTIKKLVVSPYNLTSKPFARFEKIKIATDNHWKIFLYQYKTLQSDINNPKVVTKNLNLKATNDTLLISYNSKKIKNDSIEFATVVLTLNNKVIKLDNEVREYSFKNFFSTNQSLLHDSINYLAVNGTAQIIYKDSVLGYKRKIIPLKQNFGFYTPKYIKHQKDKTLFWNIFYISICFMLLLLFLYYINKTRIIIITPVGKVVVKNGFFIFNKKENFSSLLALFKQEEEYKQLIALKSIFILFLDDPKNYFENNEFDICIISKNEINVSTTNNFEEEKYPKGEDKMVGNEGEQVDSIIKLIDKYNNKYHILFINPNRLAKIDFIEATAKKENYFAIEFSNLEKTKNPNNAYLTKTYLALRKMKMSKEEYLFVINKIEDTHYFNLIQIYGDGRLDRFKLLIKYKKEGLKSIIKEKALMEETLKEQKISFKFKYNDNCKTTNLFTLDFNKSIYLNFISLLSNDQGDVEAIVPIYNPLKEKNSVTNIFPVIIPNKYRNSTFDLYKYPHIGLLKMNKTSRDDKHEIKIDYKIDVNENYKLIITDNRPPKLTKTQ